MTSETNRTTGRADYANRLDEKRWRLKRAADNARQRSDMGFETARTIADGIPLGQPILVGHHSERRHRRDLEKIERGMRRGIEEDRKATYLTARADGLGSHGISNDDPEALPKLRARLAELEAKHDRMKRVNAIIRKHRLDTPAAAAALASEFGGRDTAWLEFLKPDVMGDIGYPAYAISNSNANIKRIKDRIAGLEKVASVNANGGLGEIVTDHYTVTDDVMSNRVVMVIGERVGPDVFKWIRSMGWRWSRSESAFLAYRNKWQHLGYFLPELEQRAGWAPQAKDAIHAMLNS